MEQATNSLSKEIEAMAAIGRALGDLTDPAARQRVLRWACERFALDAPAQAAAAVPAVATVTSPADADLTVDNLTDMFAVDASANDDDSLSLEPRAVVETEKTSLETAIRSFAADFQRFADEWNGAAA